MSIFNGKDGYAKKKDQYISDHGLSGLDPETLNYVRDKIALDELLNGAYPTFSSNDAKTLNHNLEIIKEQNWIKIRQNDEIIKLLKKQ